MTLETIDEQTSFRRLPWEKDGRQFRVVGAGSNAYATALEARIRALTVKLETAQSEAAMAIEERQTRVDEMARRLKELNRKHVAALEANAADLVAVRTEAAHRIAELQQQDLAGELVASRSENRDLRAENSELLVKLRATLRKLAGITAELAESGRTANEHIQDELNKAETMARRAGL